MVGEVIDLPIANSLEWQLAFLCACVYWACVLAWTAYLLELDTASEAIE